MRAIQVLTLIFALLFCTAARAHTAQVASGLVKLDRDGGVKITLTIDLPAFLLNDTPVRVSDADMRALLDGPVDALVAQRADAQDRLLHSTQLKDGQLESVTLPSVDEIDTQKRQSGAYPFPMMMDVTLAGRMTPGASSFAMRLPEALGQIVLTVDRPDDEPREFAIEGSDWSPEIPMTAAALVTSDTSRQPPLAPAAVETKSANIATALTPPRFRHVISHSVVVILLIVGLFLLCWKVFPLLVRIKPFGTQRRAANPPGLDGSSPQRAGETPTPRCASERF